MQVFIQIEEQPVNGLYPISYMRINPFEQIGDVPPIPDSALSVGYLINDYEPLTVIPDGKVPKEFYNETTGKIETVLYDYEKTPEQLLEERLSATEIAIANMMGV